MFVSLFKIWNEVLPPTKFDGTFSVIFVFKFKAPLEFGFNPADDEFKSEELGLETLFVEKPALC